MPAFSVRVHGRVQGVFFRQGTVDEARRLGLSGWVRNCSDGSVEAVIQGEDEPLQAMLAWLHRGPPAAHVDTVSAGDTPVDPDLTDFTIRYSAAG